MKFKIILIIYIASFSSMLSGSAFVSGEVFLVMKSGIYKIHWKNCEYFYYGQTVNFINRKSQHFSELRDKKHCNSFIQRVYNKYGKPIIELIESLPIELLNEREQFYIDSFYDSKFCCNLDRYVASSRGRVLSEVTKRKISIAQKGKHRKPITEIQKIKISIAHTGLKKSESHKANISIAKRGVNNPMYGKTAVNKRSVLVFKKEVLIGQCNSLKEAQVLTGADFRNIHAVCNKKRNSSNGFYFKYL